MSDEDYEASLIALDACANCDYPICDDCGFAKTSELEVDRKWQEQ